MFAPRTQHQTKPALAPVSGIVRRGCAWGSHSLGGGAVSHSEHSEVSHTAHDVLRPSGQPPDHAARASTQPRFGHDFSRIGVHSEAKPAESSVKPGAEQAGTEAASPHQGPDTQRTSMRKISAVEHNRQRISASIRRVDKSNPLLTHAHRVVERPCMPSTLLAVQNDAMPGGEQTSPIDFSSLVTQSRESIPEPREGETVRLPDIVIPATAGLEQTDAIASTLSYNPSIAQSGPPPSPFGATLPYTHAVSGITVTPTAGTYNVTATIDNPITFQVSGAHRPDIASDVDPDINQGNYTTVASDLTPDMANLNGRPPRNQFWAEDLCIRHERFHATEDVAYGRSGVTLAENWLNTKVAASVAEVNVLLGQVPARVAATVQAAMAYPGRELRAYGDGAPLYLARATAIKTKGDAGGYAVPGSRPTGPSRGAKTAIGIGGGALAGAGIGALAGGPVGAAVGAGIGALVGGIGSLFF